MPRKLATCVWTANPSTSPVVAGWLKALCSPWTASETYTHSAMPVADKAVPGGWRQQSTLGCYMAEPRTGNVFAISYRSKQTRYCATIEDARAWIESAVSAQLAPVMPAERLGRILDGLAEYIENAPAEALLEDARQEGHDPEQIAAHVRDVLKVAVKTHQQRGKHGKP